MPKKAVKPEKFVYKDENKYSKNPKKDLAKGGWGHYNDDIKNYDLYNEEELYEEEVDEIEEDEGDWEACEDYGEYFDDYVEPEKFVLTEAAIQETTAKNLNSLISDIDDEKSWTIFKASCGKLGKRTSLFVIQCIIGLILKVSGEKTDEESNLVGRLVARLLDDAIIKVEDLELCLASSLTSGNTPAKLKYIDALVDSKIPALNNKDVKTMKETTSSLIKEYFTSNELAETQKLIHEKIPKRYHFEVVKRLCSQAMDSDNKCRELASNLIGHENSISRESLRQGFTILLERLDDTVKDVPDAVKMLACFISRAIADEAIYPLFINEAHMITEGQLLPTRCLQKCHYLINLKFSAQRLQRIWGPGRSRPVSELKSAVTTMLKEFFVNSNGLNELAQSLKELNVPNFHHEFVKQTILKSSETNKDENISSALKMIKIFVEKGLISKYQVRAGFKRINDNLKNYSCDCVRLPKDFDNAKKELKAILSDK